MTAGEPVKVNSCHNRASMECNHGNRPHSINSTDYHSTSVESVPLQSVAADRMRRPASHLHKQWSQQEPLTHQPSPAFGPQEGDEGPAKDPPHLSELHSSPSVSGGMTTGTPPLSIPPLSTPSLSTTARSRKLLCKSHSVGSLGSLGASSESPTLSSIWEAHSYDTVPDFLSSIGFDDFQSRNLIPDRFITPDVECAKPSFMRQATIGSLPLPLLDPASLDQVCVEEEMCEGQEVCVEPADNVPLGATAETVVVHAPADLGSDPLQGVGSLGSIRACSLIPPQTLDIYSPSDSLLPRQPASLETVPEETASDLVSPRRSPHLSPRLSPRLSVDYSNTQEHCVGVVDVSQGLLGAGLTQRLRQHLQPLPLARDRDQGLLQPPATQLSFGESDGSSLYFSVASQFEEREREEAEEEERRGRGSPVGGEEGQQEEGVRRRRRGHYAPPPQLLTWLRSPESLRDVEEQPWPFSETPPGSAGALEDQPPSPSSPSLPVLAVQSNSSNNSWPAQVSPSQSVLFLYSCTSDSGQGTTPSGGGSHDLGQQDRSGPSCARGEAQGVDCSCNAQLGPASTDPT